MKPLQLRQILRGYGFKVERAGYSYFVRNPEGDNPHIIVGTFRANLDDVITVYYPKPENCQANKACLTLATLHGVSIIWPQIEHTHAGEIP